MLSSNVQSLQREAELYRNHLSHWGVRGGYRRSLGAGTVYFHRTKTT